MKTGTKRKTGEVKAFCRALVALLLVSQAVAQPGNYVRNYTNGRIFQQSSVMAGARPVRTVRTYYPNGQLMREESFILGVRNGFTRLYDSLGRIQKVINFRDGKIAAYESFLNGATYTKISEDRSEIVNRGRRVAVRWGSYYHLTSARTVIVFNPRTFIDALSSMLLPENITQVIQDMNDFFSSKGGANMGDMFTCGGGTSVFDDKNIAVASASMDMERPAESRNGSFETLQGVVSQQINRCASQARAGAGLGGDAQRQQRVGKARAAAQGMIAGCRNRGSQLTSMAGYSSFSMEMDMRKDREAVAAYMRAHPEIEKLGISLSYETMSSPEFIQIKEGLGLDFYVSNSVDIVATAIGTTPVLLYAEFADTWNWLSSGGLGESMATRNENEDPEMRKVNEEARNAYERAERERRKAYEDWRERKAKEEKKGAPPVGANTPSTPGGTGSGKTPSPDTDGTGDACARMQSFVNRCETNQWQSYECENFIRIVNNCAGDVTVAMPAPDGDIWALGCGNRDGRLASQEAARQHCQQLGLIAMPRPDGNAICGTGKKNIDMAGMGEPDPRVINPTRGDFSTAGMAKQSNIRELGMGDLKSVMSSGKPALVVFMDPDCGSCQTMANTIQSPNSQSALAGYDVVMVDVGKNPSAFAEYGVNFVPFYFTVKNGRRSDVTGGAMDEKQFNRYMGNNK